MPDTAPSAVPPTKGIAWAIVITGGLVVIVAIIIGAIQAIRPPPEKNMRTYVYMKQLEVAIAQYDQIYSYLPYTLDHGTGSDLVITDAATYDGLLATLSAADQTLNPRRQKFIELDENDAYLDPWGNAFIVALDLDYDDTVTHPDVGTLKRNIIIWSPGPDGMWEPPVTDTKLPKNRDNVASWDRQR